jgi:GTP cyclohydrolase IA
MALSQEVCCNGTINCTGSEENHECRVVPSVKLEAIVDRKSNPAPEERFKKKQVEAGVRLILQGMGVDLEDENFKETPQRFARGMRELCSGLYSDEKKTSEIFGKHFDSPYDGMIVVGPIHSSGICPHHLLPVHMTSILAYIPNKRKLGLSKLARAIRLYSSRPAMQETISTLLVSAFEKYVKPQGVALWIKGSHACMTSRGVIEPECKALTLDVRGLFKDDPGVKTEFAEQLKHLTRI